MITRDSIPAAPPRGAFAALNDSQLVTAVMRRLAARSHLSQVARDAWSGIVAAERVTRQRYVGEAGGTFCGDPNTPASLNFDCGNFSCDGDFVCEQTYNCDNPGITFSCSGALPSPFSCGGAGEVFQCYVDVYDCSQFTCQTPAGAGGYDCDGYLDYVCDAQFYCLVDFQCTGGHIFFCMNIATCATQFGCAAGGTACDPTYPYNPPGGDGDPGDFMCGTPSGFTHAFYCGGASEFSCNSKDDFDFRGPWVYTARGHE